jgi:hypothetical protein
MNLSPEQMAQAQEQMKSMSPEELEAKMKSAGGAEERLRMQQMGMDPGMYDQYMKMMQDNPEMLKMAQKQMADMSPAQMAAAMPQHVKGGAPAPAPAARAPAPAPAPVASKLKGEGAAIEDLKSSGNAFFKQQRYIAAMSKYREALVRAHSMLCKHSLALTPSCTHAYTHARARRTNSRGTTWTPMGSARSWRPSATRAS